MKTGYFLDERAFVMGDTLIRLNVDEEQVRVGCSYGGSPVTVLGSGAVVAPHANRLTLEEGFIRLESGCMIGNLSLREICLPATLREIGGVICNWNPTGEPVHLFLDRRMNADIWGNIRQRAISIGGKQYALSLGDLKQEAMRPAEALMTSLAAPVAAVRKEMRCVFLVRRRENDDLKEQLFSKIDCLDLKNGHGKASEMDTVMEMIRTGNEGLRHAASEAFSDLIIRKSGKTKEEADKEVCLICCGPGPAENNGVAGSSGQDPARKTVTVRLHLLRQKAFFPSLRYVRSDDADWWIYSRNYLTGNEEHPYIRMEMGVFSRQGLVTDRKQAEAVYAKYRFLSML